MDEIHDSPTQTNRRQFGQALALLAAAPLAEEACAAAEPTVRATDALFEIVRSRYSKFLTPAQLENVKRGIARHQKIAEMLREVKLPDGAEPAVAFRADLP